MSLFSVICIYVFITCFPERSLISSGHIIGSGMDPNGLTRSIFFLWCQHVRVEYVIQTEWVLLMPQLTPLAVRCAVDEFTDFMVRQHNVLLATLVQQKTYWSSFILSTIWSLPDLSLPLPVMLPRTVSLHKRGRGRRVGAERCTKRKMKFPGHSKEWGAWWAWRRECLLFISSSRAISLKKG